MSTPITPCLWYVDQAQEAAEFYCSVLPDSHIDQIMYVDDDDHPSGRPVGAVLCIAFTLEGRPFLALNGGPGFPFTQAISLMTFGATQADIDARWDGLLAGGHEEQCGWLVDRYGLSWQVVPECWSTVLASGDRAAIARAHRAMISVIKPDVAAVEAAIRGE